jgi:hypothetical protein
MSILFKDISTNHPKHGKIDERGEQVKESSGRDAVYKIDKRCDQEHGDNDYGH